MRIASRILSLPFVIPLLFIAAMLLFLKYVFYYCRHGGEFITYGDKDEPITIKTIYDEIKKGKQE